MFPICLFRPPEPRLQSSAFLKHHVVVTEEFVTSQLLFLAYDEVKLHKNKKDLEQV